MQSVIPIFMLVSMAMLCREVHGFSLFDISPVTEVFRFRDCGHSGSTIRFHDLNISPHPVRLPGLVYSDSDIEIVRNITQTMKLEVEIARKVDLGWFGHRWVDITPYCLQHDSCREDMCDVMNETVVEEGCPQEVIDNGFSCACPPLPGSYTTTIPLVMNITEEMLPGDWVLSLMDGTYRMRASIFDGQGADLGCLDTEFGLTSRTP